MKSPFSSRRTSESSTLAAAALFLIQVVLPMSFVVGQGTAAFESKAAGQKVFYSDERAGNNQVTVFSESTLEDFTSVCNRVAGQCTIDPKRVETFAGRFSIRVEDLTTGMELRDQHMVAPEWLDAAQFPEISVQIDKVEEVSKTGPNTISLFLMGTCTIRGATRPVRISANLTYLEETPETMRRVKGDLLRIRAEFDVKLADYGINGPPGSDFIGLKVAESVKIKVTVFGSTERPPDPLKVDRPEGKTKRVPIAPAERRPTPPTATP